MDASSRIAQGRSSTTDFRKSILLEDFDVEDDLLTVAYIFVPFRSTRVLQLAAPLNEDEPARTCTRI